MGKPLFLVASFILLSQRMETADGSSESNAARDEEKKDQADKKGERETRREKERKRKTDEKEKEGKR